MTDDVPNVSRTRDIIVTILTCPTTGGVTSSFGMLGDIVIAEPKAYIAFAGKRVIEHTLRQEVPNGSSSYHPPTPKKIYLSRNVALYEATNQRWWQTCTMMSNIKYEVLTCLEGICHTI